jgi:hypothetical protein
VNINNNNNTKFNLGGVQSCFIFDEENNTLPFDSVKPETPLITIIDFEGIKFTSKSFQFEINARQMLIVDEKPIFKACLIKQKKQQHNDNNDNGQQDENCEDGVQQRVIVANANANTGDAIEVEIQLPKHLETLEPASAFLEPASLEPGASLESASTSLESASTSLESASASLDSLKSAVVKEEEPNNLTKTNSIDLEDSSSSSSYFSEDAHKNDKIDNNVGELIEVTLDLEKDECEKIKLKAPDDVYYKMYKDAKEKAKAAKNIAIEAYLAAEEIKLTYNLNNVDSSDSSDGDDSSESSDNEINNDNN